MANDTLPDYDPADGEARRKAILEACDADRAINEALGTLHALFALGDMLSRERIADNLTWVMALGESIRAQADEMRNFLDRPYGWNREAPESADQVVRRINRIASVRDLTAEEARDGLHAETVREIRREYPDADEREIKLRVAIRESIGMTPDEEERAYDLISAAVRS